MTKRRNGRDSRCPNCRINMAHCFCEQLSLFPTKTVTTFLVHIRESVLPSNTAHIAMKSLENSSTCYRGVWNDPTKIELLDGHTPLYLFPDDDAVSLTPEFLETISRPIQLIVPDGSWSITRKIKRREGLTKIQSVKLPFVKESEYKLRHAPIAEGLCTIEAAAYALGIIESKECEEHLLKAFRLMNSLHYKARNLDSILSKTEKLVQKE